MIQRIPKGNDLIDTISGNIGNIRNLIYYTTDSDNSFETDYEMDGDVITVYLNAQDLDKLERGQLHCRIEKASPDPHFVDGEYNEVIDQALACWLC